MLSRDEVDGLLQLHGKAYDLLLWLGGRAKRDPDVLSPETVGVLRNARTCHEWLESNRSSLPSRCMPSGEVFTEFGNLLSSFFSTSFRVDHISFGDRLLDASLATGTRERFGKPSGLVQAQALALKHLAQAEGLRIPESEARRLAKRKSVQPDLLIWTYVWELDRRAKGKGKGPVVHKIWRSLPRDVRKNLTTERVWAARARVLDAARALVGERSAT